MTESVVVAIVTIAGTILAAAIGALATNGRTLNKLDKKIDMMTTKIERLERHDKEQYLSILKLMITNADLPLHERINAARDYRDNGGDGEMEQIIDELFEEADRK